MSTEERVLMNVKEVMNDMNYCDEIELSNSFVADLGFESVRLVGLFYLLEEEFDIQILSGENNHLFFAVETVQDLIDIIEISI